MNSRRTSYEIYWEMLAFCKPGKSFTQVIGRCDLNSKIGQEHVGFLISKGYLVRMDEGDRQLLKTTAASKTYLDTFATLYQSLFQGAPGVQALALNLTLSKIHFLQLLGYKLDIHAE